MLDFFRYIVHSGLAYQINRGRLLRDIGSFKRVGDSLGLKCAINSEGEFS